MKIITIVFIALMICGCSRVKEAHGTETTNGTAVLIFPEWKASNSAFERKVYTNYFAVYSNGFWFVRERQSDGSLAIFWKLDEAHKSINDAKELFGLNIQWNIYKAIHDAL